MNTENLVIREFANFEVGGKYIVAGEKFTFIGIVEGERSTKLKFMDMHKNWLTLDAMAHFDLIIAA